MRSIRVEHLLILVAAVAMVRGSGLQEVPLLGDGGGAMFLDGEAWTASNGAVEVSATVPGDLITDLQRSGLIADPLFNLTFRGDLWDQGTWTFTSPPFSAPDAFADLSEVYLVFDSVKMAAFATLNGVGVGAFADQFTRHVLGVKTLLKPQGNLVRVSFPPSTSPMNNETRWMACSGGWDWAPYSTSTFNGSHTFSKGIVKSVYLVPVREAAIASLVPQIYYDAAAPASPLPTGELGGPFTVNVTVHLMCPASGCSGRLSLRGNWSNTSVEVNVSGRSSVSVLLPRATHVRLWWPNGVGGSDTPRQPYWINAEYWSRDAAPSITTGRAVGFRVVNLVTANETTAVGNGSGNFTMRFKVNGADVWARGASVIPMDELEGRQTAAAYVALIQSAAAANFNMLRVWGGGVFFPPVFYDTCDALGIMIFHDMMYGQPWFGGTVGTPKDNAMQREELRHNIRNLAHHPSIVLWNGGNEWQSELSLWNSFVIPTVVAEDSSRPVWPISPSRGWLSGVDTATGLPNGEPFVALPHHDDSPIETHGPYRHGSGFKTVNSHSALKYFSPNLPPSLQENTATGAGHRGTFATEFGCSVFSSFESMSPTLFPQDWAPHSPPMVQRNYACDSLIWVYFGAQDDLRNSTGSVGTLRKATYLCMIAQALEMKSDIEVRRGYNSFGTLTWQLNEIWPTGGWGSVEYGTVGWTDGQVLGGRWKPLHHWMAEHLYRDQIVVCGAHAQCFVKNDDPLRSFHGRAIATVVSLIPAIAGGTIASTVVELGPGAGALMHFCVDGVDVTPCASFATVLSKFALNETSAVITLELQDARNATIDFNWIFVTSIARIAAAGNIPQALVTIDAIEQVRSELGSYYKVHVSSNATAFFVNLVTLAHGRFSPNAFTMPAGSTVVDFVPTSLALFEYEVLVESTRVDHLAMYVRSTP